MASNFDTIIPPILQHFKEQIMNNIIPVGEGTCTWKHFKSSEYLEDTGARVRLFEVYVDRFSSPTNPNAIGANTTDYDVPINIDICYLKLDEHTVLGLRDFEEIRNQITNSNTSALTGYNFTRFEEMEWVEGADPEGDYRFVRIPSQVRITVTH